MENPNPTHNPENVERRLYEELAGALAQNQELIKKLDKFHCETAIGTYDPASLEQHVREFERSNSRLSLALKKWLSYVREAVRAD